MGTTQKGNRNLKKPTVISLFTCGMGMDLGFEKAKFQTVYANDITKFACNTIKKNRPEIPCDEGDITEISSKEILKKSNYKKGEIDVVIGGPPCQSFSTAGMRKGLDDKRGMALLEFIRVIRDVQPKIFVFENVPGLKSISKKRVSFYDRMALDKKTLTSDQKYGSLFEEILNEFKKIKNYNFEWKILNSADYGVPQKRKRLILIGSRVADSKIIFEKIEQNAKYADPVKAKELGKKSWRTLRDALDGLKDDKMECTKFPKWSKYLKHIPPGGCWVNLPENLKKEAMGHAADTDDPKKKGKQGGRTGFFRRLSWEKPSPTLVTSPSQMATCICHPDETRPLTVREYARIQGFPDNWSFEGSLSQKYRMIGEAVPVELARIIAETIKNII
jgi:DNA (cytosine-5)-methyltransferase 1